MEAVRCAISIQEDLRVRNSELPEAGQMWFRIGIKVTLSSLSGCFNNNTRSFGMNVRQGKIDESQQPFPKTGTISDDGAFSMRVTDRAGNLWATQTGTITGDSGEGTFRGVKPSRTGTVTLMRLAARQE